MPTVDLLNVPRDPDRYPAYLANNFRRVADVLMLVANLVGDKDIEITSPTRGIILRAPNGTRYRVTVDNTGTLIRTAL